MIFPLLIVVAYSHIHRRAAVKELVSEIGENRIHLEEFPSYAPYLNPTEWMWNHIKRAEMRNLVCLIWRDFIWNSTWLLVACDRNYICSIPFLSAQN